MADYAYNKLGARTAGILFETGNDYSEGLKDAFVEKAAELGLEVVATEAFATGDKDVYKRQTRPLPPRSPRLCGPTSIPAATLQRARRTLRSWRGACRWAT